MRRSAGVAAVIMAIGLAMASACAPAPVERPPAYADTLRPVIERTMKENAIPGAVVLVRSPGQGDWLAAVGSRVVGRDEPMSAEDYFRVGSNTKTMTSTVILQLAQEGRLRLDDPVSKYRPGVPNGDKITIAQLSDMRSGLYSYTFDRGFNESLDRDPGKVWTPEELLAIAFAHPVNFAPGQRFDYCNTNTILLGLIIERLTGMPAAQAFQQRIFTPLGLAHTSLPAGTDASLPDPHPRGYSFGTNVSTIDTYALPPAQRAEALAGTLKPNDDTDASPSWAWTAGGAISTVGDLAVYVRALVGGGLLNEQTQKLRLDSIQPTDPAQPTAAGYGLGIARFGPLIGHDGQIPGFMTFMGHDPTTARTIVIATNLAAVPSGEGSALTLLKAILPVLYPAAPGSTTPTR